ncbi:F-box/LRR-repeat protein At5g02910-like [Cannabis sativa]|uniref:F-box/LRR-repeat protein At5g02910-like n=1 Tax=Cannabis sativa TaxID=3483 RepID=UPI0029CA0EC1|nr:F-box/LRR-repeat protein At5g02910-like [Cannabis sativa]XP_060967880.1 F-box/LRR-repeat protein At5g02910-like [Cannabis sativa]
MAEKRVKSTSLMGEDDKEDRISKLPDAIITHILSFLKTRNVIKTCILSKRWKLMWYLVPKLIFCNYCSKYYGNCKFVDNCLKYRKRGMKFIPDSVITSFKLHYLYESRMDSRLNRWLAFAVKNQIKNIEVRLNWLHRKNNDYYYYCLPETLVVNGNFLTDLKLCLVEFDSSCQSFSFSSLKSLSLSAVRFADSDMLDNLLLGSPSLEELRLRDCCLETDDQLHIHVRNSTLKVLEIEQTEALVEKIELINLESLILKYVSFDKINPCACKEIRNLTLTCEWGEEELSLLEYLISNLSLLQHLTLNNCYKGMLKHIEISSESLESLTLNNRLDYEMTVRIESAPKLASICYKGNIKFSISMAESSNSLTGTFIIPIQHRDYDIIWFINLMNFFLNLNCSWNRVHLHVRSAEALILPEEVKRVCRSPLVNWEDLRVLTECELERESDLRDALRWISPSLKTLSIAKKARLRRYQVSYGCC